MAKSETKKVNGGTTAVKNPDTGDRGKKRDVVVTPLPLDTPEKAAVKAARDVVKSTTKSSAEKAAATVAVAMLLTSKDASSLVDRSDAADAAEKVAADAIAELEAAKTALAESRDKVERLEQKVDALKAKYESAENAAEREEAAKRLATFEAVVASLQGYGARVESLASMLMAQSTTASATMTAVRELGTKVDGIKIDPPVDPTVGFQALSAELATATAAITERMGSGLGALPAAVAAAIPTAPVPIDHTAAIEAVKVELGAVRDRVMLGIASLETSEASVSGRSLALEKVADVAKQVEDLAAVARGSATMSAAAVAILAQHLVKIEGVVADATVKEMADLARTALA